MRNQLKPRTLIFHTNVPGVYGAGEARVSVVIDNPGQTGKSQVLLTLTLVL